MNGERDLSMREYEREADMRRHRLATTLAELGDSLTPGRMLDEVLSYARSGGGDFLKGLGNAASANPVPTLLIGAGALLFMTGTGRASMSGATERRRSGRATTYGAYETTAHAGNGASGMAHRAAEAAGAMGESASASVQSGLSQAGDAVARGASAVSGGVSSAVDGLREGVSLAGDAVTLAAKNVGQRAMELEGAAAERVRATAQQISEETSRRLQDAQLRVEDMAREQPLLVAAMGVALGAAVAAMLPRSRTEDQLMGEASDAVKQAVGTAASEQYEQAKAVAGRVAQDVKESVAAEGVSPQAAAQAVRGFGDRVASAIVDPKPH